MSAVSTQPDDQAQPLTPAMLALLRLLLADDAGMKFIEPAQRQTLLALERRSFAYVNAPHHASITLSGAAALAAHDRIHGVVQ